MATATRRTSLTADDANELAAFVKGRGKWNPDSPCVFLTSIVADALIADGLKPRDADRVAPSVLRRLASFRPAK